jgi:ferredoxin-NADP reductase
MGRRAMSDDQLAGRHLRIRTMTWEAEGVLSITLVDPLGQSLPAWEPGAHLDLDLPAGLTRQYSLCSDPCQLDHYRIAVLHEPVGRGGSAVIHSSLRPGDLLTVRGPRNHFELVASQRYLFIAGGIGITPIFAMLCEVERTGADWKLLYGGRSRASMAFTGELLQYGDKVLLAPQDEVGLLPLGDWLGTPDPTTKVYCCGPERLITATEERCKKAGWPTDSLHVERFAPKAEEIPAGREQAFEVVCRTSEQSVIVEPGWSVMEALRQAGVEVPSSCEEGVCGSCETDVLEGTPDHRDSILTDSERAEGRTMFVCVSRALSPRLVLDL